MADLLEHLRTALADRYLIERELGRGGAAIVYLAEDRRHQRRVALKVLRPELAASVTAERFLREIRIAAQLSHPNILPLYESGRVVGSPDRGNDAIEPPGDPPIPRSVELLYYTMPYVAGESLRERLEREHQLPIEDALRVTRDVAAALGYAHAQGIVHRDIKPANILFQDGRAVVADFGIARAVLAATDGEALTETGLAVGTPAYMSPEQGAGSSELDGRSDIYSLGCVLYEMLSGETPYTGRTPQAILAKKLTEPLPRITTVRAAVPAGLEAALSKALARSAADRFATAAQLADALATGTGARAGAPRPRRFGRLLQITAAVTLLAVVGGAFAVWQHRAGTEPLNPNLIAVMPFRAPGATPEVQALAGQIPDIFWMKVTGEFGPHATDPATVLGEWEAAGGTPAEGLPEGAELRIARGQAAGRLVRGLVTETEGGVAVTASLIDSRTGAARVAPTTVRGPLVQWSRLTDSLIVLLLTADFGMSADQVLSLARHPPEAVQAYLEGVDASRAGDFRKAGQLMDRAYALDSTFVLVPYVKYASGESDTASARIVWDHLEALSPRDRAFFRALAGWRFGATRTMAEAIAQWDSVARPWPEWFNASFELGEELIYGGALAGEPQWQARAFDALERGDPQKPWLLITLLRVAFAAEDTARIDRYLSRFPRDAGEVPPEWAGLVRAFRWRQAVLLGDSAAAARAWPDTVSPCGRGLLLRLALIDGRGVVEADRVAAELAAACPAHVGATRQRLAWARGRGRHAEWLRLRDAAGSPAVEGLAGALLRLRDALFLGEPEDSAVRAAARFVAGQARSAATPGDRAAARCWDALWRLRHGDTTGGQAAKDYLLTRTGLPYPLPVCAGLIDVLQAMAAGGDVRTAVLRWDSIVRPAPMPAYHVLTSPVAPGDGTHALDNLLLARLLLQYGDMAAALAASRRRDILLAGPLGDLLVDFLREEGRLAALTGDTAGAIRAYDHYLALRENPDWPPWVAVRDSVRVELAALRPR